MGTKCPLMQSIMRSAKFSTVKHLKPTTKTYFNSWSCLNLKVRQIIIHLLLINDDDDDDDDDESDNNDDDELLA